MSDISDFLYSSASFGVGSQESVPQGLFFKPDGTKMYVGGNGEIVYQYTLSTAWNLSTASYASKSFNAGTQVLGSPGAITGLFFKPDGTKMYVLGGASGTDLDGVYQYSLSTPWDVSTASYDTVEADVSSQTSSGASGLFFKPDGTKMYVSEGNQQSVYQYSLSSAWNLSTASYDSKEADVSVTVDSEPEGVSFNSDGTKMYVADFWEEKLYQYSLSTPWDVSTASYDSVSLDISNEDNAPLDIVFMPTDNKMYVLGGENDSVYQYGGPQEASPSGISSTLALGTPVIGHLAEIEGIPSTASLGTPVITGIATVSPATIASTLAFGDPFAHIPRNSATAYAKTGKPDTAYTKSSKPKTEHTKDSP